MGQQKIPDEELEKLGLRILGLDPGLGTTGWGVIEADGNRLRHVANGQIRTDSAAPLPKRLAALAEQLEELIAEHGPEPRLPKKSSSTRTRNRRSSSARLEASS